MLVANKAFDMAESVADGFASSIATSSLVVGFIGLVVVAVAVFWARIVGVFNRVLPSKKREMRPG
jgi:uncharacterized BrkB/YihY/UPF0761 family membrane protein